MCGDPDLVLVLSRKNVLANTAIEVDHFNFALIDKLAQTLRDLRRIAPDTTGDFFGGHRVATFEQEVGDAFLQRARHELNTGLIGIKADWPPTGLWQLHGFEKELAEHRFHALTIINLFRNVDSRNGECSLLTDSYMIRFTY